MNFLLLEIAMRVVNKELFGESNELDSDSVFQIEPFKWLPYFARYLSVVPKITQRNTWVHFYTREQVLYQVQLGVPRPLLNLLCAVHSSIYNKIVFQLLKNNYQKSRYRPKYCYYIIFHEIRTFFRPKK